MTIPDMMPVEITFDATSPDCKKPKKLYIRMRMVKEMFDKVIRDDQEMCDVVHYEAMQTARKHLKHDDVSVADVVMTWNDSPKRRISRPINGDWRGVGLVDLSIS